MARNDPVCGMMVDEGTAKYISAYRGKTYYFCSLGCQDAFEQAPERYVKPEQDPVCGMIVDDEASVPRSTYQDRTYYFCFEGCKIAFDVEPERYAARAKR